MNTDDTGSWAQPDPTDRTDPDFVDITRLAPAESTEAAAAAAPDDIADADLVDIDVDVAIEVRDVEKLLEVVGCDLALFLESLRGGLRLLEGLRKLLDHIVGLRGANLRLGRHDLLLARWGWLAVGSLVTASATAGLVRWSAAWIAGRAGTPLALRTFVRLGGG